jgi:hypothetical protein
MGTYDGFTHGMSLRFCDSHHIRDLFPQELKTEKAHLNDGLLPETNQRRTSRSWAKSIQTLLDSKSRGCSLLYSFGNQPTCHGGFSYWSRMREPKKNDAGQILCDGTSCQAVALRSLVEYKEVPRWRRMPDRAFQRGFEECFTVYYCAEHESQAQRAAFTPLDQSLRFPLESPVL